MKGIIEIDAPYEEAAHVHCPCCHKAKFTEIFGVGFIYDGGHTIYVMRCANELCKEQPILKVKVKMKAQLKAVM